MHQNLALTSKIVFPLLTQWIKPFQPQVPESVLPLNMDDSYNIKQRHTRPIKRTEEGTCYCCTSKQQETRQTQSTQ